MNISTKMKKALESVVKEVAAEWVEMCEDEYDAEDCSLQQYARDVWPDEGYDLLDDVSMYIDSEVKKQLK